MLTFLQLYFGFPADVETEADVASRLGVIYISTMFVGIICLQVIGITSMYKYGSRNSSDSRRFLCATRLTQG